MRKKIDDKIKQMIENSIIANERSVFIIVGDRGRDQIVTIHSLYDKIKPGKRFKILWCYKDNLGFSQNQIKNVKKGKNMQKKGLSKESGESSNNFPEFIIKNDIKYCYYRDTQRVLGNTFNMVVLQDFEAITPNVMCRTIETVAGGGIVIFLLSSMTSLKQMYTISMDCHDRYRTSSHNKVEPRFNERFILSLADCKNCIVMDDELNLLPISSNIMNIAPIERDINMNEENVFLTEREKELKSLKDSLKNRAPIGALVSLCMTMDQAKCVMAMVESISEKNSKNTVAITASRGRGKSSAMGLAISSAIVFGFSNIFVTAPSPENLKTFFEFVISGLKSLNYREKIDFDVHFSTDVDMKSVVVKINVFKDHKQSINYIHPNHVSIVSHAEIIVIDEAAAIPLHVVKNLMGPCLIFMASTIHGYEGTGRSLSLKLIKQLREQSSVKYDGDQGLGGARLLKEVSLDQAIRYADQDPIESWLNKLLCLDATTEEMLLGFPHPNDCELYQVNRDTLFSYHKASEGFLKKLMSLFVSSHYKNSPNDLQLLSDAPAHSIFILTKNINKSEDCKGLPDVFAAIQICEEGGIAKDVILEKTKRGDAPPGDLIPWTVGDTFQDKEFPNMTGVRIVRIATHSQAHRMGYGTRALQLLSEFFEGKIVNLDESMANTKSMEKVEKVEEKALDIYDEVIKPKKKLKPLLTKLSETKPPLISWLGTAFGLTPELFNFWKKNGMNPVYLKLSENDITGEHSCIMLKPMKDDDIKFNLSSFGNQEFDPALRWLLPFTSDFKKRFVSLLGFDFRSLSIKIALNLLDPKLTSTTSEEDKDDNLQQSQMHFLNREQLNFILTKYDFKRLELYNKNLVKYTMILDLLPDLAKCFFLKKFNVSLAYSQAAILLGMGLQFKSLDQIKDELNIPVNQVLALFNKMIKKFTTFIRSLYEKELEKNDKKPTAVVLPKAQISMTINEELKEVSNKMKTDMYDQKKQFINEKFGGDDKNGSHLNKKRERTQSFSEKN